MTILRAMCPLRLSQIERERGTDRKKEGESGREKGTDREKERWRERERGWGRKLKLDSMIEKMRKREGENKRERELQRGHGCALQRHLVSLRALYISLLVLLTAEENTYLASPPDPQPKTLSANAGYFKSPFSAFDFFFLLQSTSMASSMLEANKLCVRSSWLSSGRDLLF